jgi:hypothetical protein
MQIKSIIRIGVAFVSIAFTAAIVSAQGQSAPAVGQQAGPAWSPAQNIGMFAFPKNGQSADQQLKDEKRVLRDGQAAHWDRRAGSATPRTE